MKLSLAVLAVSLGASQANPHLRIKSKEGCTLEGRDMYDNETGGKVPCCDGLVEELTSDYRHVCKGKVAPCAREGEDVWATGQEVPCCSGLVKELTNDGSNWRFVCKSSSGPPPSPTPPAPTPTPPTPVGVAADLGLCYGYGEAKPNLEGQINNDMERVNSCSATSQVEKIRNYFPSYYGQQVTQFSAFSGKKLLPGFNPRDAFEFKAAIEKDLREVYGEEDVEAIIYLNEKYESQDIQWAGDFIESMESTRTSKPILTSQTLQGDYGEYTSLLAQGFDGIMINVYPSRTFQPFNINGNTVDPEEDFNSFCYHLKKITDYYTTHSGTGENFYGVSETGMPSHPFGNDVVKAFFDNIKQFVAGAKNCPEFSYAQLVNLNGGAGTWLGVYGFAATSEPNKGSALENSFGITDAFCSTTSHEEEGNLVSIS